MNKIAILFIMSYVLSDCDDSIHPLDYTYAEHIKDGRIITPMLLPSLVTRLGFEPKTPSLKVKCSTY